MTNHERIKSMSTEELGRYFCEAMEIIIENTDKDYVCDICPVEKMCSKGHNGFIAWLNSEEAKPLERICE